MKLLTKVFYSDSSNVEMFIVVFVMKQCIFTAAVPVMETPPQNVTVLDGKDATITCRAAGAPTPNVTWIYQGMCVCTNY